MNIDLGLIGASIFGFCGVYLVTTGYHYKTLNDRVHEVGRKILTPLGHEPMTLHERDVHEQTEDAAIMAIGKSRKSAVRCIQAGSVMISLACLAIGYKLLA